MRIAVVTGGRADYGLLVMPMRKLAADPRFSLRVIATGQHLGPTGTLGQITADGFTVDETVEILSGEDSALAICRASGRAVSGIAEALSRQAPDLVLLLGDRYEILAAALAAHLLRLPIAHIAGGDLTEGAVDDALRHAITKLAHLHFVTNEDSARRVRQMGEPAERVHRVGNPALDRIAATALPDREAFFEAAGLPPRAKNLLVTFHPVTAEEDSVAQAEAMLAALPGTAGLIFTGVNADAEGRTVEVAIRRYCETRRNAVFHDALGPTLYFAALTHCDAVIGNSSSGLYEAPSFKIPTVNIGNRQTGRLKAASVIDVVPEEKAIAAAIARALSLDCSKVVNPYGDGHASERILSVLAGIENPKALLTKPFSDLKEAR
jgi:UDP-hydrolysing UDP-N-acetyl-D-glucosamine 2-epimerase